MPVVDLNHGRFGFAATVLRLSHTSFTPLTAQASFNHAGMGPCCSPLMRTVNPVPVDVAVADGKAFVNVASSCATACGVGNDCACATGVAGAVARAGAVAVDKPCDGKMMSQTESYASAKAIMLDDRLSVLGVNSDAILAQTCMMMDWSLLTIGYTPCGSGCCWRF